MISDRRIKACIAICLTAILGIAVCGCDDLGAYSDTEEYYNSFGDVVLISGNSREEVEYSVEDYFYNKESREDFLDGEDGAYSGVEYSDYVYMAVPLEATLEMDAFALYICSGSDATVYINVFITDEIPTNWKGIEAEEDDSQEDDSEEDDSEAEETYDDPAPETRVGELVIHLTGGNWNSFVLEKFNINGVTQESVRVEDGQYILLQIRNNSGIRIFDEENQIYVDPQTGIELPRVEITMTNMLVRALNIEKETEEQEGE